MTRISESSDKAVKTSQDCENVSNISLETLKGEPKVEYGIAVPEIQKTEPEEPTCSTIKPTQGHDLWDTNLGHENTAKREKMENREIENMENRVKENYEKSTDIHDEKIFLDCLNIDKLCSQKATENTTLDTAETKTEQQASENKEHSKNLKSANVSDDENNPWKDNNVSTVITNNDNFQNIPLLKSENNHLLNGGIDNAAFVSE